MHRAPTPHRHPAHPLPALSAVFAACLLAACGGGGGSDSATPTATAPQVSAAGVVAKGKVRNALVKAYAVKADGSLDTTALATTTTDGEGRYSLPAFDAAAGTAYIVKMTAQSGTEHLDEVSGAWQAVPSSFSMRAAFVATAAATQNVSLTLTPFSEMAVAAAGKASGGLTSGNVAQANSTVQQLLGFDPTKQGIKATTDTSANADEKKLATLLTAVSQLAADQALGCTSGDAGTRTECVVNTLAASASSSTLKLQSGSTNVSAVLASAVSAVAAAPALAGVVDRSLLTAVVANLGCSSDAACAAAAVGSNSAGADAVALTIANAKLLFSSVKADIASLVSPGGVSAAASGALNQQGWKFQQVFEGTRWPVDVLVRDLDAINGGIQLHDDYFSGLTSTPYVNSGGNSVAPSSSASEWGCTYYQDSAYTVTATAKSNANFLACAANYYATQSTTGSTTTIDLWRHRFLLTPQADGSWTWSVQARHRVSRCVSGSCTLVSNDPLQFAADGSARTFTGTASRSASAALGTTALSLVGQLPGAYVGANVRATGNTVQNDHHDVNIVASAPVAAADGSRTLTISSGRIVAYADATTPSATIAVKRGTASGVSGAGLSNVDLDVAFTSAQGAEFEGTLVADTPVWDSSHSWLEPTHGTLTGALRTTTAGTTTEFLNGKLTLDLAGYAAFNASQGSSAGNAYTLNGSFVGTLTAPGRPALEITLSGSKPSNSGDFTSLSGQLRSLVGGTPRNVVTMTTTRNASTGGWNRSFSEAVSGLSLVWADRAATANLSQGSTRIGSLDTGSNLLTFTDGSFMSLDLGL